MENEKKENEMNRVSIGSVLVELGALTEDQLKNAVIEDGKGEMNLAATLIRLGYVTEAQITKALGVKGKVPYFDSLEGMCSEDAAEILSEEVSRKYQVVPMFRKGNTLLLAMLDPFNIYALDDISRLTGLKISPVISTQKSIFAAISQLYSRKRTAVSNIQAYDDDDKSDTVMEVIAGRSEEEDIIDREIAEQTPIIKLVNKIIFRAVEMKASDIHLEPLTDHLVVRSRLDGMLRELMTVPRAIAQAVTSRIKIMAKLDITETRRPQDGRIKIKFREREIDLRISTVPTVNGEKTVIRILDRKTILLDLGRLGLPKDIYEDFKKTFKRPNGILLVTGPTGSGKTTTLYGVLSELMDSTKNISTLEDPVEYQIDGINQIQINANAGVSFANGLRALLRQDPNIILVGEIRDPETADISIQAALTGHMVFATLHTNDASGAVARLLDMGVEPFLLSSALAGVLAQRLVRLLCGKCKTPYTPQELLLTGMGLTDKKDYTFYKPAGCPECFGTGYKGRTGVFEFLMMNKDIQNEVLARSPHSKIYEAARKSGFKGMFEQGVAKVISGETSAEELLRVTRGE